MFHISESYTMHNAERRNLCIGSSPGTLNLLSIFSLRARATTRHTWATEVHEHAMCTRTCNAQHKSKSKSCRARRKGTLLISKCPRAAARPALDAGPMLAVILVQSTRRGNIGWAIHGTAA